MYKYIIGIDGGGTKTLGVLYNLEGKELKRIELGFSNFSIDEHKSKKTLKAVIANLFEQTTDKVFVQMGIAGASRLKNKEAFIKELEEEFNIKAYLDTDAHIALYSTVLKENESLIMAIGGTGSIVMTNKNNQVNRLGGWGHLLGDEGSAYHLSIMAIKNIINEFEDGKPYSYLSNHLLKHMEIKDHFKIIEYVYNLDKSTIALLSTEIQKASNQCEIAKDLLIKEGHYLAKQIINAYNLYIKEGSVVVSLRGSFAQKALFVKETVIKEVSKTIKDIRFDVDAYEPVYGAYQLAKKYITGEIPW